jgi:hypothetical protein
MPKKAKKVHYALGGRETAIHLACADGATAGEVQRALGPAGVGELDVKEIREVLDELTRSRLVFADDGRYLALALPWRLPKAV